MFSTTVCFHAVLSTLISSNLLEEYMSLISQQSHLTTLTLGYHPHLFILTTLTLGHHPHITHTHLTTLTLGHHPHITHTPLHPQSPPLESFSPFPHSAPHPLLYLPALQKKKISLVTEKTLPIPVLVSMGADELKLMGRGIMSSKSCGRSHTLCFVTLL